MKVLFCDNNLKFFLNFRKYIVEYLHNKGYELGAVVPSDSCTEKILNKKPKYLKVFPINMNGNSSNPFDDIIYFCKLFRIFKAENPNIIFVYTIKPNIYGSIAASMLNIPIVAMVAGLGYVFTGNGPTKTLGRMLYKFGLHKANNVIVLNETNKKTLIEGGYVKPENMILFDSGEGVDLNQFKYNPDAYESVRFLMVSRILYDKGYSEFVEAAKIVKDKYPNVKFELLGPLAEDSPTGVPKKVIDADQKNGFIEYLGETDDVPYYLRRHGVVSVLLSSYNEGFNRSLMEACAMGRICITSDTPGCKEIVDNGVTGILVKPKDSSALADAMIKIIEMPSSKRYEMSKASYKKASEHFDVRYVYKKYDYIISQLTTTSV